jgi:hypothetical protein
MIEKIKNNFLGIITAILLALLFLMSPSFRFSKYNPDIENNTDPNFLEITNQLELINYKLIDKSYAFQEYVIPRLVFNAYPENISFKHDLNCSVYEIEVDINQIDNIKEKLIKIKADQKKEFDDDVKSGEISFSQIYLYKNSVPFLKNGQINLDIANKYIDLCASENSLAKIKEQNAEVLGDFDFFWSIMGYIPYPTRAYPILINKGAFKSRIKIIVFDGFDWWYYSRFPRNPISTPDSVSHIIN